LLWNSEKAEAPLFSIWTPVGPREIDFGVRMRASTDAQVRVVPRSLDSQ